MQRFLLGQRRLKLVNRSESRQRADLFLIFEINLNNNNFSSLLLIINNANVNISNFRIQDCLLLRGRIIFYSPRNLIVFKVLFFITLIYALTAPKASISAIIYLPHRL